MCEKRGGCLSSLCFLVNKFKFKIKTIKVTILFLGKYIRLF